MLCRFIFFSAVSIAVLVVFFLALFSPLPHTDPEKTRPTTPWLALSLYIQQPKLQSPNVHDPVAQPDYDVGALIFHHKLTEGPENTSRIVGKAQGFIIPVEDFARSAFNIIYLTFDTPEYSGSLSVKAKYVAHGEEQQLTVVGGTGSFAFARGLAIFAQADRGQEPAAEADASAYHVKLQLRVPDRSRTIPG